MDHFYPAGPATVPDRFTEPTAAYKSRAWLAIAGLGSFVVAYVFLTAWFTWTAYRLLRGAVTNGGDNVVLVFVVGLCSLFFAVFMAKALFFVKHRYEINDIEITSKEHPRLFAFLHRLADEAKAPRPHRLFLSPRVNAAVFYDLSVINLIFPSKKNLEIGLALVNVLTIGELKAVLAHEFGHFAQRSMSVGRWVYIAQQIAGHIIAKRDALDGFLRRLSRFDIRIAWIGWLLSLIIWSIRSVMETLFRLVILTQRALAREMEFQADLVAVSLTGSDALIHALHRLQFADDAWQRALNFAGAEATAGRKVKDIFAIQTRLIEHLRTTLGRADYGQVAPVPAVDPGSHRLFKTQLAQAPQMWSTHPSNCDRENNAKRTYIPAPIDESSAWDIFDDVQNLKERMTAHLIVAEKAQPVPLEDSLGRLNEQYSRPYLNREYRGAYLGRSIVRHATRVEDLYDSKLDSQAVAASLEALYPESLAQDIEQLQNLQEDKNALEALQKRIMDAPGGVIRHRGRELKRRDLPRVITELDAEIKRVDDRIRDHDRRCRTVHLSAAAQAGMGWEEYLTGLAQVIHYADHAEANLRDAHRYLANVFAVVTASGRVSKGELEHLLAAANGVHLALTSIHRQADQISLDTTLTESLSAQSWKESLGKFDLVRASKDNINQWLQVIDSWVNAAGGALMTLRMCALDRLLLEEKNVARAVREGIPLGQAPAPSRLPSNYLLLTPGSERPLQQLSWWDRFQIADGIFATVARLAVVALIVVAAVMLTRSLGEPQLTIYNGLARGVHVEVGDVSAELGQFSSTQLAIPRAGHYTIRTRTMQGREIEAFDETLPDAFGHYVYNVAGASPMLLWTVVYGNAAQKPERLLGTVRWTTTSADVLFSEPPRSVNADGGGASRDVLTGFGEASPYRAMTLLSPDADPKPLLAAHARWDDLNSRHFLDWLMAASHTDGFVGILNSRLSESPRNPLLLRVEQDTAQTAEERETVCARDRALATASADNPDFQYLADRCIRDEDEKGEAFISHYRTWPKNGWLALAAGYTFAEEGRWADSLEPLDVARRALSPMTESATLDLGRFRRVSQGRNANLSDLQKDSEGLRDLHALESGNDISGPYLAYRALEEGKLEEALKLAGGSPKISPTIIRFVGASDGASREMTQMALRLPRDSVTSETSWVMLGLAAREHTDIAPYLEEVSKSADLTTEALRHLIQAANNDRPEFERLLAHTHPVIRAHAYVLGLILVGKDSPAHWREGANRLLFAAERPYFVDANR